MFTNNFIKLQRMFFLNQNLSMVKPDGASNTAYHERTLKVSSFGKYMVLGRCRTILSSMDSQESSPDNYIYPGVYFGAGTTAASKDDYTLENPITAGLSISNNNIVENNDNGAYMFSANYLLTNTTDAEMTISELGVFLPVAIDSNTSSQYNKFANALMERSVLNNPVVIPPGETKFVTYKLTFNQGENV